MTRQPDLFSVPPADPPAPLPGRDRWHRDARRIAKRHAFRDNWLGRRWSCGCGACNQARWDGLIPRESIARYR